MSAWDEAARAAGREEWFDDKTTSLASGIVFPSSPQLVVVDHFEPTMIDMPTTGAVLRVRPLSKIDAMDLVMKMNPPIVAGERIAHEIARDLGMAMQVRPRVGPTTSLLVRTRLSWNDVRWHHVTYEADG